LLLRVHSVSPDCWDPRYPVQLQAGQIRRIEIVLPGDSNKCEQAIAPGIGQCCAILWGAAVSPTWQTGQSEDTHSPEEWASTVVNRMSSASMSMEVVWTVAISCLPIAFRTRSSPLESEA
jgi:hypothetical protein